MKSFVCKFKFYILSLILCSAVTLGLFGLGFKFVSAEGTPVATATEFYSPNSAMEYCDLTAPKDACLWDDKAAIIMGNSKIHLFDGEKFSSVNLGDTIVTTQIKKIDDKLVVASLTGLYYINATDFNDYGKLTNSLGGDIGGQYFDFNGNYIVTSGDNTIAIYQRVDNDIVFITQNDTLQFSNTRVSITDENYVFYNDINEQDEIVIYKSNVDEFGVTKSQISKGQLKAVTVFDNYFYYALGSAFYRVPVTGDDAEVEQLTVNTSAYELGNLTTPNGVSARKDGETIKLIITDSGLDAVQEFSVVEGDTTTLSFTGFAIAKGKTAYNRLENTVSILEKFGDKILTVDDSFVTVIKKGEYFKIANDIAVTVGAIGEKSALISNGNAIKITPVNNVQPISFTSVTIQNFANNSQVTDACYQNGNYYLAVANGESKTVYSISENGVVNKLFTDDAESQNLLITVDAFDNVYLSDNGKVSVYYINNGDYVSQAVTVFTNPEQITVDLEGRLFALNGGIVCAYDGVNTKQYQINNTSVSASANAFAFDVTDGNVYFIFEGEEIIAYCDTLENLALDGAVSQTLFKPLDYISSVCYKDTVAKAYVTTSVNLYFLPKITEATPSTNLINQFSYTYDDEGVIKPVRLSAGEEIIPTKVIRMDGLYFYLVDYTFNGATYQGYIPVNFTTTELTENSTPKPFTLGKVSATKVYSDDTLNGTEIANLLDNTQVRIYSNAKGVTKIEFLDTTSNAWVTGYIDSDAIIGTPNTVIRNVLIIIAVAISLCVSTLFFVLRKKS